MRVRQAPASIENAPIPVHVRFDHCGKLVRCKIEMSADVRRRAGGIEKLYGSPKVVQPLRQHTLTLRTRLYCHCAAPR